MYKTAVNASAPAHAPAPAPAHAPAPAPASNYPQTIKLIAASIIADDAKQAANYAQGHALVDLTPLMSACKAYRDLAAILGTILTNRGPFPFIDHFVHDVDITVQSMTPEEQYKAFRSTLGHTMLYSAACWGNIATFGGRHRITYSKTSGIVVEAIAQPVVVPAAPAPVPAVVVALVPAPAAPAAPAPAAAPEPSIGAWATIPDGEFIPTARAASPTKALDTSSSEQFPALTGSK